MTVMEIGGKDFNALATDGDVQLGGKDWDQRLVDYVAEEFIRKFGVDPREDAERSRPAVARVRRRQADAFGPHESDDRLRLSRPRRARRSHAAAVRGNDARPARPHAFTTRQTLQAAGLEWTDIDRVLLVGGTSRMPMVVEMLRQLSGKEPDCSVSPDEAVAHGAALHAGLILSLSRRQIADVSTFATSTRTAWASWPPIATTKRPRNAILIPRNTPLPVTARRIFKTHKAGQQSILVQIVEGESPSPDDCSQLGKCSVRNLPPDLPAQTPIEVRFRYEENGRLTVNVQRGRHDEAAPARDHARELTHAGAAR